MIKLEKGARPRFLEDNAPALTQELQGYIDKGETPPDSLWHKYSNLEVREALTKECSSKCMFCEGRLGVVGYSQIEHYRPKRKYPQLAFDWDNLGLACEICNKKKGDEFDEALPILNPYTEEPSDHLVAAGTVLFPKPGNDRATLTIGQLDLNRSGLLEERLERFNAIGNLIQLHSKESNPTLKVILRSNIDKEVAPEKPHSYVAKCLVETLLAS